MTNTSNFMRLLLSLITLFSCLLGSAQDWEFSSPNYKKIEKNIAKKKSNLYYENLLNRFNAFDSTMTLEEKRHLYYGFSFQDAYSPYGDSDYKDSLDNVLGKDDHGISDLMKIVSFSDSILAENPFDLNSINFQLYALNELQQERIFNERLNQTRIIIDAILSSGDGSSEENAFYVIEVAHEYFILDVIGFEFGGSQSLKGQCDYLTLQENELSLEGLYFNVSACMRSLNKMFKN